MYKILSMNKSHKFIYFSIYLYINRFFFTLQHKKAISIKEIAFSFEKNFYSLHPKAIVICSLGLTADIL